VLLDCVQSIFERASEDACAVASKLLISLLHHARGSIDRLLPRCVSILAAAFSAAKTEDFLGPAAVALAMCLQYSASGTLAALLAIEPAALSGGHSAFSLLQAWFRQLSELSKPVDLQISALGLSVLLAEAASGALAAAAPALLPGLGSILALAAQLVQKEDAARLQAAAERAEAAAKRGGARSEGCEDGEAEEEEEEEEQKKAAAAATAAGTGGEGEGGEEDEGDEDASYEESEYRDSELDDIEEDEEEHKSPLDHVHTLLFFSRAVQALASSALWQGTVAALSPDTQALLQAAGARAAALSAEGKLCGELGPGPEEEALRAAGS